MLPHESRSIPRRKPRIGFIRFPHLPDSSTRSPVFSLRTMRIDR